MERDAHRLEPLFAPWLTELVDEMAEARGCTCEPFMVRWVDRTHEGEEVGGGNGYTLVRGTMSGMTMCHADDCPCEPHADQAGVSW